MHTVTLHPSGHHYESIPHRSILESGLAHGLALPHRCANGSCGTCTARLLEGTTERLRPHDFTLSQRAKAEGHFLMCCHVARSDIKIVVTEVASAADIPVQQLTAKIERCRRYDNVLVVTLRFTRGRSLQYLSGQSVRLHQPSDHAVARPGDTASASLKPKACIDIVVPVASCPCETGIIEVHLPTAPGDTASAHWCRFFETAGRRARIDIEGPYGDFTLQDIEPRSRLMVCVDTGFARSKALIEQVFNLEHETPLRLLRLVRLVSTSAGETRAHSGEAHCPIYLENLCRSWQDSMPNFSYQTISVANSNAVGAVQLPITRAHLGDFADTRDALVYISSAPAPIAANRSIHDAQTNDSAIASPAHVAVTATSLSNRMLSLGFQPHQIVAV